MSSDVEGAVEALLERTARWIEATIPRLTDQDMRADAAKDADGLRALLASHAALTERVRVLEGERDEAIRDRNAHAEHVLRVAKEAEDGMAALEEIDRTWEAIGIPNNRKIVTLPEQIASIQRERDEAEARAEALERRAGELEGALRLMQTAFSDTLDADWPDAEQRYALSRANEALTPATQAEGTRR